MKTKVNLETISEVAQALGKLNDRVVYVGGAVVSLYANDLAADEVRETFDIDISLEIASLGELELLRQQLSAKGFTQSSEDNVICRFRYKKYILVDVMSTEPVGWAPANPWFAPGFKHLEKIQINDKTINILPISYFLATKFTAFHDRGGNDPRTSQDLEDITYILDNTTDLVEKIINSPDDVKQFLKAEFIGIIERDILQEAILGNLFHDTQTERFNKIIDKLKLIIDSIQ